MTFIDVYSRLDDARLLHRISHDDQHATKRQSLTDDELPVQVSRIRLSEGSSLPPHGHATKSVAFDSITPPETWIILKGSMRVTLHDTDGVFLKRVDLISGSVLVTFSGGHAIEWCEADTEMIEVKLGPYLGNDKIILGT
jgi:mannose-6-phosphate isomerase-like protein (cupin superfamily)